MVKREAVLFDLDNTLYDYEAPHKKALAAAFSELKKTIKISKVKFNYLFKISKAEIKRELSGTASAHNRVLYFQRLIEKTHNTVNPTIILKLYDAYWNSFLKNVKPFRETLRTLKEIKKKGLGIAIVSDMTTHIQLKKLKKLGISKYVDFLITSEESGSEKPNSIMFLLALNKLKTSPDGAIMVGDNTVADIEGANSVGLFSVLIKKGPLAKKHKEDYQKPNATIKKISEVLSILDELE
ncbi:HAD-IA family hydrolase [archaeon]|nr:HAD-IA family hydrolase [archaeon]MBT3577630.1 HAD-IA family hydrolase [archaeon]MBT6819904.1 HAD-IA family hydrolase [archaeon]MBT6956686.1 HAD-IA family hydrolase [archaeon]MBT7025060.1 HAD-IA family hydrolase [archaeon]